jgi:hypothetical protein
MTRRPAPAPRPGSLDLTLWGPDERCLLISGPLPLLGELLRTMQLPASDWSQAGGTPAAISKLTAQNPESDGDAA